MSARPVPGRVALLAASAAYEALVVLQAVTLPQSVPAHVGPDGTADRWEPLAAHLVTATLVGLATALMFWFLPALMGRFPSDLVNLPHKEYWLRPENLPATRARLANQMGWFGAAVLVFIGYGIWTVGQVALGTPPPAAVFWVLFALVLAGCVAFAVWSYRGTAWRPPAD